jgi:hypothetical protein
MLHNQVLPVMLKGENKSDRHEKDNNQLSMVHIWKMLITKRM